MWLTNCLVLTTWSLPSHRVLYHFLRLCVEGFLSLPLLPSVYVHWSFIMILLNVLALALCSALISTTSLPFLHPSALIPSSLSLTPPLNSSTFAFDSASNPTLLCLYSRFTTKVPVMNFTPDLFREVSILLIVYLCLIISRHHWEGSWSFQWGDPPISLQRLFQTFNLYLQGGQPPVNTPEELRLLARWQLMTSNCGTSLNCATSS